MFFRRPDTTRQTPIKPFISILWMLKKSHQQSKIKIENNILSEQKSQSQNQTAFDIEFAL